MRHISLVLLVLVGCGTGVSSDPVLEAGVEDATAPLADAAEAGNHNNGNLCCKITEDLTEASFWQNGNFPCQPDSGIDPGVLFNVIWVCNDHTARETDCNDPACVVGSHCQGFNGFGTVHACP